MLRVVNIGYSSENGGDIAGISIEGPSLGPLDSGGLIHDGLCILYLLRIAQNEAGAVVAAVDAARTV